jgi:deoxyribodipyrimidine photo-lyase
MDLGMDWRFGAHYFEEKLIDHDVQSNYGGWAACSGIGPGRVYHFNTVKQSKDFDTNGDYIRMWVPELTDIPAKYIHEPWSMPNDKQQLYNYVPGKTYPKPIDCPKYTNPNQHYKNNKNQNNNNNNKKGHNGPIYKKKQVVN